MNIRPPAVAGLFYPGVADALRSMVEGYVQSAGTSPSPSPPKALIVPHAGYTYSGPVAGFAYASLKPCRDQVKRVVMFSPAHRVPIAGLALPEVESFSTPLGAVPLDHTAMELAAMLPCVHRLNEAHHGEHGLEVQLPFLQILLSRFVLVPFVVGDVAYTDVADVMAHLWGGPETLIVVSSDLSHYLDYDAAHTADRLTAGRILGCMPEAIKPKDACGHVPIQALLQVAEHHALEPLLLDLRNSGDTTGERDRVVGYGAFAFA